MAKGLLSAVSDGIGMILGVQTGGVSGSDMKLGTVERVNLMKKFWGKVRFFGSELSASGLLDSSAATAVGCELVNGSSVTEGTGK